MENNHRSAQSILLSNTSSSNGTATNNNNNSSPQSHSLSRRASFTSCEINSLNEDPSNDHTSKKNYSFIFYIVLMLNYFQKRFKNG